MRTLKTIVTAGLVTALLAVAVMARPEIRTLQANMDGGRLLQLEDDRIFEVHNNDTETASDWKPGDRINIRKERESMDMQWLVNLTRDEKVRARRVRAK